MAEIDTPMEQETDTSCITSTEILDRVNALLNLQDRQNELTEEMEKEILAIEKKYLLKFQPLAEKRSEIVSGKVEPAGDDIKCKEPITVENLSSKPEEKGIPGFWVQVLKNTEVQALIEEVDAEPLNHLTDIKIVQVGDESDYSLEFYFSENPYFTNSVITKTVSLKGDELDSIVSTPINWKDGKNFTIKTVKKSVKGKGKGKAATSSVQTIQEDIPCFFSTFLSPADEEAASNADEEGGEALYIQYQIIAKLKDIVIPNAVEFFLGRASDEDEYGQDGYDFDGEDDDDEEFDDEEDDDEPRKGKSVTTAGKPQQPSDCKQQ